MKVLSLNVILAAALGLTSLSTFANESAEIPTEIIQQLPAVEPVTTSPAVPASLPTVVPEEGTETPVATDAPAEPEDASAEEPAVVPAENP